MREDLIEAIKQGNTHKFYISKIWRRKRRHILERDNFECQKCKSRGKFHVAETVHHKKHLKEYPELGLTDDILISLCNACHNEEHPEKPFNAEPKKKFMNEERWE